MPDNIPHVIVDRPTAPAVRRGPEPTPPSPWWHRRSIVIAALAVGLVALLYGIGFWITYDKVPHGTTVAGVAVGGRSTDAARKMLTDRLDSGYSRPVAVAAGASNATFDPRSAGLALDVDATVRAAMKGSAWSPAHIFFGIFGGGVVPPVVTADDDALATAVAALADQLDVAPVDGALVFTGAKVSRIEPVEGIEVDRSAAAAALRAGFVGARDGTVELPATFTEPAVDKAELDRAVTQFAEPALAAPVSITAGATTVDLTPADFAPFLTMSPDPDGTLQPALDATGLLAAKADLLAPLVKAPKNASFTFVDGKPAVIPSENGTALDAPTLGEELLEVLPKTGDARVAAATVSTKEPDLTTADAQALGITEPISEFTTQYPIAAYRITNIGRAAQLINGSLVLPGAIWSLNDTVGERTEANGFVKGFIIDGGQFREDLGGGVSQVATTTFNAVFFAGLEDVEHKPHSFYISRYPAGREATVAWPTVDLKFRNDTNTGVLIQTIATPGQITVRFWGTKKYDEIRSVSSARTNLTSGTTLTQSGPDCVPQDPVQGFDITVTRQFVNDGQVVRSEDFATHYNPADRIICG